MRLLFEKCGKTDFVGHVISWRCDSEIVHCELLFSNGETFSADMGRGTRWTDGAAYKSNPEDWLTVDIGGTPEQETNARAWCNENKGMPYSVRGILNLFFDLGDTLHLKWVMDIVQHLSDKGIGAKQQWFCSSVCTGALQQVYGLFVFLNPAMTEPKDLYVAAQARDETLRIVMKAY